jgi:hypothetical protein
MGRLIVTCFQLSVTLEFDQRSSPRSAKTPSAPEKSRYWNVTLVMLRHVSAFRR